MFMTGMGTTMSAFFQTTTMIISIPSVVILTALLLSLWGASIRYNAPMLFALAFLPMFAIGGLTGLPLGLAPPDIHLHDTYYVIGHFHYVVAPGTIFALFAGIYYWFPKATGRRMKEMLGQLHFWTSFIVDRNPWEATTLEWSAPSPPGHGNFLTEPVVYRGPYEYSVPGAAKDFTPQFEPERA
jgi:cytochrome c oxidase subunit 1